MTFKSTLTAAILAACSLSAGAALADHVNDQPTKIYHSSSAQAGQFSHLIDLLVGAGLTDDAAPGAGVEEYDANEFSFGQVLVDGVPLSRQVSFRKEGVWHDNANISDDDASFAYLIKAGHIAGFGCKIGYVSPLLQCTRTVNLPESTACTLNYRCISAN